MTLVASLVIPSSSLLCSCPFVSGIASAVARLHRITDWLLAQVLAAKTHEIVIEWRAVLKKIKDLTLADDRSEDSDLNKVHREVNRILALSSSDFGSEVFQLESEIMVSLNFDLAPPECLTQLTLLLSWLTFSKEVRTVCFGIMYDLLGNESFTRAIFDTSGRAVAISVVKFVTDNLSEFILTKDKQDLCPLVPILQRKPWWLLFKVKTERINKVETELKSSLSQLYLPSS